MGRKIGYSRTNNMNNNSKLKSKLIKFGCEKVFIDNVSGMSDIWKRPEFLKLLNYIEKGDSIVIPSSDRLTRIHLDYREAEKKLNEKGIKLITLTDISWDFELVK